MKKPLSQKAMVKSYLDNSGRLTQLAALNMFGSLRLSHIVWKLKKEGMEIDKEMIRTAPSKFSKTGKLVAVYFKVKFD